MLLINLLSIIPDETPVNVYREGRIIARYDGKESIDDKYNKLIVKSVSAGNFNINIEV